MKAYFFIFFIKNVMIKRRSLGVQRTILHFTNFFAFVVFSSSKVSLAAEKLPHRKVATKTLHVQKIDKILISLFEQESSTHLPIHFWSFVWMGVTSRTFNRRSKRTYRPYSSFALNFRPQMGPIWRPRSLRIVWSASVRQAVILTSKAHKATPPCISLSAVSIVNWYQGAMLWMPSSTNVIPRMKFHP